MSVMVFFVLSFFPRGVLDGIWDLIESESEGFPTYPYIKFMKFIEKGPSIYGIKSFAKLNKTCTHVSRKLENFFN